MATLDAAVDEGSYRALYIAVEQLFRDRLQRENPISVSVTLQRDLRAANAVLSSTSNGSACVEPSWLADAAIVCDAARPGDMAPHLRLARPDVTVFEGGLVRLPEPVRFGRRNVLDFATGINLACLSETMALTMGGVRKHSSLGNRIALSEAVAIAELATSHGFECFVPPLSSGLVTEVSASGLGTDARPGQSVRRMATQRSDSARETNDV